MTSRDLVTNLRALKDGGLPLTFDDVLNALDKTAYQQSTYMSDSERTFVEWVGYECRRRVSREGAKKAA